MEWLPDNQYYYDTFSPAYATFGCCSTNNNSLCEQIGIDQEPKIGKDGFQVWLDVSNFKPNEITVDTENNIIVVHAKQEQQRNGNRYMSREFVRQYELPEAFKPEDVVANLSCDGILMIRAPNIKYRSIQIQQTGPARMCIIDNVKSCDGGDKGSKANDKNEDTKKDNAKADSK